MIFPDPAGPLFDLPADYPIERPTLRYLVWYSVGGSLPERYWPWVFRDTTSKTWALREFARFFAILTPLFVVYFIFIPGSLGLRLLTGVTFFLGILLYLFVNILVLNDRRAVRAGCPTGLVADVRSRRSDAVHHLAVVARNERIAERRQRRLQGRR